MWPIHLLSTFENRKESRASRRQHAGRPRRAAVALGLEPLEERWLLNATITVTTTADDPSTPLAGQTTLRDAINQANANPGSTIEFAGALTYKTIQPEAALPTITGAGTTIAGIPHPVDEDTGFYLDGSNAPTGPGLNVAASNVMIENLIIINFGVGINVEPNATDTTISRNSIGFNSQGVVIAAASNTVIQSNNISQNAEEGILVYAGNTPTSTTIGGPVSGDGNYIQGGNGTKFNNSANSGIDIYGDTQSVVVQNNTITHYSGNGITVGYLDQVSPSGAGSDGVTIGGTGAAANSIVENIGYGVEIDGSQDLVQGNDIGENGGGVEVYAGDQDTIQGNSIYSSKGILGGIFLNGTANNSTAAPVLTSVDYQDSSGHPSLTIQGNLSLPAGSPNGTYTLELFATRGSNGSNPQGETSLGSVTVTAGGGVTTPFTAALTLGGGVIETSSAITATLTDPNGNTSGFSNPLRVTPPSVITVTTTADDPTTPIAGQTTLRDAINVASENQGSKIVFNIPTTDPGYQSGVWTIKPTSGWESLRGGATIDGTSQASGALGKPVIVLDGSLADAATGLDLIGSNNVVEGLDIVNWFGQGIYLDGSTNNVLRGNYIGIDPTGTKAEGNGEGVRASGQADLIGGLGPGEGNIISGNIGSGIEVNGGVTVEGNRIGTGAGGKNPVGNGGDGVSVDGPFSGAVNIGGTVAGAGNIIAYNDNDGVEINTNGSTPTTEVPILGNSIYGNNNQGIQLQNGSNNNQVAPDLATVAYISATTLSVSGALTGPANTTYRLEFFFSPPGNNVQGQIFLGARNVTTNGGTTAFTITLNVPAGLGTTAFTATATDPNNNTSPFSNAVLATSPPPTSPSSSPPPSAPASSSAPPSLNVPPLLAFFDAWLGGIETVNANGTETIVDSLFGIPLLVSTFDHAGNLLSVDLLGFNVTSLFA
jgi:parallel beta-helix repeat protein